MRAGRGLGRDRTRPRLRHVEAHVWYRSLDLTVEDLAGTLQDGDLLLDYSAGTGMLLDRLRLRIFDRRVGVVIVDRPPKFLRVALEKFRGDRRSRSGGCTT